MIQAAPSQRDGSIGNDVWDRPTSGRRPDTVPAHGGLTNLVTKSRQRNCRQVRVSIPWKVG
jgi:hypothetical protein